MRMIRDFMHDLVEQMQNFRAIVEVGPAKAKHDPYYLQVF